VSWVLASGVLLGLALVAGFAWYERAHPTARVLALVATLAALAAIGRIAFAPIPNVKPTTDIVLLTGYVLGGAPGFAVGAVTAIASNVFFGQGPWTPWQMVSWGIVGLLGAALAALAGRRLGRIPLALACGLAGALYGAIMNLSLWVLYAGDHTAAKLGAYFATSLPFDLAHIVGNVVFCLAFGPALVTALSRFRERFTVTWHPAPAVAAAALLAVVLAGATSTDAVAKVPQRSVDYLLDAQNPDGGFPPTPGARSTQLHTGWTALGLAAAGRNPVDVNAWEFIAERSEQLRDAGALSRTILVAAAAGRDPTNVGGRDLLKALIARRSGGGAFEKRVNTTAFAILALRAAGRSTRAPIVRNAGRWIAARANDDGGFNFAGGGGASGIDDTGAVVQALVAAGRRRTPTVRRAIRFLVRRQNRDGGFPLQPGGASNAQSTAWAVQALVAARRNPAKLHRNGARSPLAYLRSLIATNGAIRYSRTSTQTPVWVTGQALAALARKPLPLARVPRAARAAAPTPTPTATPAPEPTAAPKRPRKAEQRPSRTGTADLAAHARAAGYVAGWALAPLPL
jgi:energy-coupling factor transport system substrate-specific component